MITEILPCCMWIYYTCRIYVESDVVNILTSVMLSFWHFHTWVNYKLLYPFWGWGLTYPSWFQQVSASVNTFISIWISMLGNARNAWKPNQRMVFHGERCNLDSLLASVIKNILPVTCPITRDISRLKPVSAQILQSHLLSLLPVVKEAIKNKLPYGSHLCLIVGLKELTTLLLWQQHTWRLSHHARGAICLAQHLMIRTNIKALMFSHFTCFKV